ncbi:hypothetical protein [Nonomuraea candida]|uniref:hypothetical protein n=1 Tax=Nonomuraea candida TaxID=359159 RepID=UPI0012F84464|nr:hypothetical protein [Nonomuraea candida]
MTASALASACQQQDGTPVDTTPLPSIASPPYVCDYIPLDAVRLMTGVQDPIVDGKFDMKAGENVGSSQWGSGGCFVYQPTGDKPKVLNVSLSPDGTEEEVVSRIRKGAGRLPEIVPGSVGFYFQDGSADNTQAAAVLVHGQDRVTVELVRGVKGRDNAADAVALMTLIAPNLILDATPSTRKTTMTYRRLATQRRQRIHCHRAAGPFSVHLAKSGQCEGQRPGSRSAEQPRSWLQRPHKRTQKETPLEQKHWLGRRTA